MPAFGALRMPLAGIRLLVECIRTPPEWQMPGEQRPGEQRHAPHACTRTRPAALMQIAGVIRRDCGAAYRRIPAAGSRSRERQSQRHQRNADLCDPARRRRPDGDPRRHVRRFLLQPESARHGESRRLVMRALDEHLSTAWFASRCLSASPVSGSRVSRINHLNLQPFAYDFGVT